MKTKIFKIAFNNVIKQKRRSMFNALTFAANAFTIIFILGMMKGMYNTSFERTIELETGHFKIYHSEYAKNKDRMPLEHSINNASLLINDLKTLPNFISATPRISKNAEISDMKKKTGVIVLGIDMQSELETMKIFDKLPEKHRLAASGAELLMGARLAHLMKVAPESSLLIHGQTMQKANNLSDLTIKGIYSIGFEKMEKSVVYVPISFAQDFFDMPNSATEIIIRINNRSQIQLVKPLIEKILNEKYPDLVVKDWTEEAAGLITAARMDYVQFGVLLAILLFLAVFIIMNTLTITVFERTSEIGTLRAIGLERKEIRLMFLWEGILLALGGALAGGILAIPMAYYMNIYGIPMPEKMSEMMPLPIDSLKSLNDFGDWILTIAVCIITGTIGAILPANRAANLRVVDALKKGVR